jgi:hypothetical protein
MRVLVVNSLASTGAVVIIIYIWFSMMNTGFETIHTEPHIKYIPYTKDPIYTTYTTQTKMTQFVPSPWSYTPSIHWKSLPEIRALSPSICGRWMKSYQAFHASVSSGRYFVEEFAKHGKLPDPPVLIFRVNPLLASGDIGELWAILSTAMVTAILTRRAIYFEWPENFSYSYPNLPYLSNTSAHQVYHKWVYYREEIDVLQDIRAYNSRNHSRNHQLTYPVAPHHDDSDQWFVDEKNGWKRSWQIMSVTTHEDNLLFEGLFPDTKVVNLTSVVHLRELFVRPFVHFSLTPGNKGLIRYFFANPVLGTHLRKLGLQEHSCYGCLINFLLGLSGAVKNLFESYAYILLTPSILTVGMHLYTDFSVTNHQIENPPEINYEQLINPTFACAERFVHLHRTSPHQRVVFYLITNNANLRQHLLKIQTNFTNPKSQTSLLIFPTETFLRTVSHDNDIFTLSQINAGEHWLLSYCDYLIINNHPSGFGSSASLRSLESGHTFMSKHASEPDYCTGVTIDNWREVGYKY